MRSNASACWPQFWVQGTNSCVDMTACACFIPGTPSLPPAAAAPPTAAVSKPKSEPKAAGGKGANQAKQQQPPADADATPAAPAAPLALAPGRPYYVGTWMLPAGMFDLANLGWNQLDSQAIAGSPQGLPGETYYTSATALLTSQLRNRLPKTFRARAVTHVTAHVSQQTSMLPHVDST